MPSAPGRSPGKKAAGRALRDDDFRGRAVIVHSLEQACAALAAAQAEDARVMLASGHDAAAYLGPLWFREMIGLAAAEYPDVRIEALFDCGDRPGLVMAALRAGLERMRFTGPRAVRVRLDQMAAAQGARVVVRQPDALDLLDHPAPARACRAWLAGDRAR